MTTTTSTPFHCYKRWAVLIGLLLYAIIYYILVQRSSTSNNNHDDTSFRGGYKLFSSLLWTTRKHNQAANRHDNKNNTVVEIPTNPHATLANDIVAIHHVPHQSQVVVTFRSGATCPRPYLIGRLSGPALIKLEWTWAWSRSNSNWTIANWTSTTSSNVLEQRQQQQQQDQEQNVTFMTAVYHDRIPTSGTYFIEIISLFCEDYFYNLHDVDTNDNNTNTNNNNNTNSTISIGGEHWISEPSMRNTLIFDYKRVCMEHPTRHRLTDLHASIVISKTNQRLPNSSDRNNNHSSQRWTTSSNTTTTINTPGYWRRKLEHNETTEMEPLYTRYQPFNCMLSHKGKDDLPSSCYEMASRDRYSRYQFVWSDPVLQNLTLSKLLLQPKPTVICLVGASHSRVLWQAGQRLLSMLWHEQQLNLRIEWIEARVPRDVSPIRVLQSIQQKQCTKLVIGVGQWPASYAMEDKPFNLLQFYYEMKGIFLNYHAEKAIWTRVDMFARSVHYNPLGYHITSCPPIDWRSPPVIDGYNKVLQKACQELKIPYLDTNFLVGPVWDAAPDWCHLDDYTSDVEILYIVAFVLGILGDNNRNMTT